MINIDRDIAVNHVREAFTPTLGQTVFTIARAPKDPSDVTFRVNNIGYTEGTTGGDWFTAVGTTITWLDIFVLDTNDRVIIVYS